jgi:hypothetical protein
MKRWVATLAIFSIIVPESVAQSENYPSGDSHVTSQSDNKTALPARSGKIADTTADKFNAPASPGAPCGSASLSGTANGIFVESAKTYDDATLQQQLEMNAVRLSALSGLDQNSLTSHLGNVSGMNQSFTSASLNIQGPGTSQQAVTAAIPSTQTVQTNTVSNGTTAASNGQSVPVSNNQLVTQTTSNPATNQTVTTTPSFSPPTSTPAPVAPAVTTGFSVQSSAVLSEQMQLASTLSTELLEEEGALSDRIMRFKDSSGWHETMRPRATIGFDVTISPTRAERDAVAVVEMIVTSCEQLAGEPPAVTALIPSERTFNVAAIRNSSTSLGAGIATQFVGASGGFIFGHNSYFLVQDQDTVAQVFRPSDEDQKDYCSPNRCIGIRWLFRPVLGQRFVGTERRQVITQLAFPVTFSAKQYGQATIRTSWRHFDRKNGLVGDPLDEQSLNSYSYPILSYQLNDIKPVLNASSIEDLGGGQVMVRLDGSFLAGTYVRIGGSALVDPPSGLVREPLALRFTASAADLLSKNAFLVSKSGQDVSLTIQRAGRVWLAKNPVAVTTLDATFSHVSVSYCEVRASNAPNAEVDPNPMLLLIAGKAYGLSDAPLDREPAPGVSTVCDTAPRGEPIPAGAIERTLGLTTATATLLASPVITLKSLFAGPDGSFQLPLIQQGKLSPLSQADRLVLLTQTKDAAEFLLYGSRLSAVSQVDPAVELVLIADKVAQSDVKDNLRYVTLTAQQLQQYKFLVITRSGEAPEAISIPAVTLPDSASTPVVTGTVLKNDDTALVTGAGLADLTKIEFKGVAIPFTVAKDGKSATLLHLRKAGVTTNANLQSLDFYFKSKPVQVKVDVFTQKDQTVPR